jgi:UDP-N-acetylmuramate: L-alanyl-gamma-D-glutamyl-meso-diaminopimelate ligase
LEGGKHFVIEGDEYDSAFFDKGPKFLHYLPFLGVIGNVEFDHADIYANLDAVKLQFRRFVNLIPEQGFLAVGSDSPAALEVSENNLCIKETFGLHPGCDWSAQNIEQRGDCCCFDILYRKKLFHHVETKLIGNYNIRNSLAAVAILNQLEVPAGLIRKGLESFVGVRRRMQLRADVDGIRIYEDFAHHPTAVRETLQAIRDAFHPERIWAIYEPRSATSRRNIFQREMAEALSLADFIAIPDLFRPEKVPESERLDENRLIDDLHRRGCAAWNLGTVENIIQKLCENTKPGDLIVIMSNGGFGGIYEKLPAALKQRPAPAIL